MAEFLLDNISLDVNERETKAEVRACVVRVCARVCV